MFFWNSLVFSMIQLMLAIFSLAPLPFPNPVLTLLLDPHKVSQETGKVVWYSHLFKNFPQFVVIHTVKGFSIVTDAEVDVLLEFPCFLHDPTKVDNLISSSSAFSEPSLYI